MTPPPQIQVRRSFVSMAVAAALGVAVFFTLYSLIPLTRTDTPELSSLFLGTMMALVMGVQVFVPMMVRRFSLRVVLIGALLLMGLGALLTGISEGTVDLLAGAVASGAGFGVLVVAGAQGVALIVPATRLGRALGIFGLVTMMATAVGSPAGVQVALTFSPAVFGVCGLIACVLGAGLAFGIPAGVGRPVLRATGQRDRISPEHRLAARLRVFAGQVPWLLLGFMLLGMLLFSHGLTSLPVLADAHVNAALMIFVVQFSNALGRWIGGELEAPLTTAGTAAAGAVMVAAGSVVGVLGTIPAVLVLSAVLLGGGMGIVQTLVLHVAMRRTAPGRASVMWNLALDGGLWSGGVVWGLALSTGLVTQAVLVVAAAALVLAAVLVPRLRHRV